MAIEDRTELNNTRRAYSIDKKITLFTDKALLQKTKLFLNSPYLQR